VLFDFDGPDPFVLPFADPARPAKGYHRVVSFKEGGIN